MLSSGWLCHVAVRITRWKSGRGGTVYPFRKTNRCVFVESTFKKHRLSYYLRLALGVYVCVGKERQKTSAVMRFTCHRCLRIDKWRLENMTSPKQIFQPMSFFLVDCLQAASVFVICYKIYFFLNTQHFVTSSVHSDSCFCDSPLSGKYFFCLTLFFFFVSIVDEGRRAWQLRWKTARHHFFFRLFVLFTLLFVLRTEVVPVNVRASSNPFQQQPNPNQTKPN